MEEANWPPFTPDKQGEVHEGPSYDLIRMVFNELNIHAKLTIAPHEKSFDKTKRR